MKNSLKVITSIILLSNLLCSSCKKENILAGENNFQTNELLKVETIYKEGDFKYEGPVDEPKIVTTISLALRDKIKAELDKSYSKQISYAKSTGGNLVGVLKNGTCGNYRVLTLNMDCEDSNPGSFAVDWTGNSYVTPTNKNVILNFCVVENAYFDSTIYDYGVLMLTSILPDGVNRCVANIDNEDTRNANWTQYDGSPYSGWFGDCNFGINTRLALYFYNDAPSSTNDFPSLGISYGVFGSFGADQGYIHSDDEDTSNGNWCLCSIWNGSGWTDNYYLGVGNIIGVYSDDSDYYFSKVY